MEFEKFVEHNAVDQSGGEREQWEKNDNQYIDSDYPKIE